MQRAGSHEPGWTEFMQSPHSWNLLASIQDAGEIAPNRLYQTRRRGYLKMMLERVHCSRRGVEVEYGGSSVEGVQLSSASWDEVRGSDQ
jgi:hypothetical protein